MTDQWWSWALSLIGVAGFFLAGKKVWWCWYINIANQFLWVAYALVTGQLGFLVAAGVYTVVFVKNAYEWTRDRNKSDEPPVIGRLIRTEETEGGIEITGKIDDAELLKKFRDENFGKFSLYHPRNPYGKKK